MTFALAYLAKPKYGGWPTYTSHLYEGILDAGHKPVLLKAGTRTEQKQRPYGRSILYQNVSSADMITLCSELPLLITAADKTFRDLALHLHERGAWIVIHDPTELKEPLASALQQDRVIVIRESMLEHLPRATYIPHPYKALRLNGGPDRRLAVSVSRIDFDKHTEVIIEANQRMREPVDIYGFLNTIYGHFTLDQRDPEWKRNYRGTFKADDLWAATRIALRYRYVVDMSVIKGDGGGTQYTFLEAADAGSGLILNAGWKPNGLLSKYAHTVSDAAELVTLLASEPSAHTEEAEVLLRHHDAGAIAGRYIELMTR